MANLGRRGGEVELGLWDAGGAQGRPEMVGDLRLPEMRVRGWGGGGGRWEEANRWVRRLLLCHLGRILGLRVLGSRGALQEFRGRAGWGNFAIFLTVHTDPSQVTLRSESKQCLLR